MTMTARSLRFSAPAVQAEINVTPLIDVMLALVMILMLTAPLALHRLSLPLGDRPDTLPAKSLRLSVKATGELYLEGIAVNRAQLASALDTASNDPKPALLVIQPEATTRYEDVAGALAIAKASGLESISVVGARAD
jgi:biopolymer transport protein ExbD